MTCAMVEISRPVPESVQEGLEAHHNGLTLCDNPYHPAVEICDHHQWREGWRTGRLEELKGIFD